MENLREKTKRNFLADVKRKLESLCPSAQDREDLLEAKSRKPINLLARMQHIRMFCPFYGLWHSAKILVSGSGDVIPLHSCVPPEAREGLGIFTSCSAKSVTMG